MTHKKIKDYDVGYGRPPKATQFKKGQSGNPKGRKQGGRNFHSRLKATVDRKINITENGRVRRISVADALIRKLVANALGNDMSAMRLTIGLLEQAMSDPVSTSKLFDSESDKALLASLLSEYEAPPADAPSSAKTKPAKPAKRSGKKMGSDHGL